MSTQVAPRTPIRRFLLDEFNKVDDRYPVLHAPVYTSPEHVVPDLFEPPPVLHRKFCVKRNIGVTEYESPEYHTKRPLTTSASMIVTLGTIFEEEELVEEPCDDMDVPQFPPMPF